MKYPSKENAIWIEKCLDNGVYRVFDGQASFDVNGGELENNPSIKDINYF